MTEKEVTPERFKLLREEEKGRCEKENFVVAMLRSNKGTASVNKMTYYRLSYESMRRINPSFSHELNIERTEENFLNDFVGLYRHFFFTYEEMFNFKLKLQTRIRPTNVPPVPVSTVWSTTWSSIWSTSAGTTTSRRSSGT